MARRTATRGGHGLSIALVALVAAGVATGACKSKDKAKASKHVEDAGRSGVTPTNPPHAAKMTAQPMAGPFKKLKAYCAGLDDPTKTLKCKPKRPGTQRVEALPPYKKVRLFFTSKGIEQTLVLAIKTDAGWFTHEVPWAINGEGKIFSTKLRKVRIIDAVPGGTPEVELRSTWIGVEQGKDGLADAPTKHKQRRVCGIGPSGKPSCLVLTEAFRFASNKGEPKTDLYFSHKFQPGGSLVITEKTGRSPQWGGGSDVYKHYAGTYVIAFP